MDFYHKIRATDDKSKKAFPKLKKVYKEIPETKGCMDHLSQCHAYCCRFQTPQLLYAEFLLIWNHIASQWNNDEICDLFERCMLCAVDHLSSKRCVFFDPKKSVCLIHDIRPYNCRVYGHVPSEEFNPRYERLKEEYAKYVMAAIHPQCDLVKTKEGEKITTKDTNRWWGDISSIEFGIGVPQDQINDDPGGSYRAPHDHILLYMMPDNVLNAVGGISLYEKHDEKMLAVHDIMMGLKKHFKGK